MSLCIDIVANLYIEICADVVTVVGREGDEVSGAKRFWICTDHNIGRGVKIPRARLWVLLQDIL